MTVNSYIKSLCLAFFMVYIPLHAIMESQIIAKVNDDIITKRDYEIFRSFNLFLKDSHYTPAINIDKTILSELIDDTLLSQAHKTLPQDPEIAEQVNMIIEQIQQDLSDSDEAFIEKLASYKLTIPVIKNRLYQIQINLKGIASNNRQDLEITLEQKMDWLAKHSRYDLWDIHTIEKPTEQSQKSIEPILKQSQTFQEAKQALFASDSTIKLVEYQNKTPNELPSLFENILTETPFKQLSQSIQAPNGYHTLYIYNLSEVPSDEQAFQAISKSKLMALKEKTTSQLKELAYIKIYIDNEES